MSFSLGPFSGRISEGPLDDDAGSGRRVLDRILAAMKDLEFPVTSQAKDALEADLTARNASNTSINIKLMKMDSASTEVHIRVGTFGDESMSHVILNKINSRLQTGS